MNILQHEEHPQAELTNFKELVEIGNNEVVQRFPQILRQKAPFGSPELATFRQGVN